ncbi:hypothetical protein B0H16DRAFT_926842 [Mycena metata]|uniref:Transmembrane protein n=1 Tax=Mycena metata TaxID=1033252 RepID=A0AAD7INQ7_9AGAR|nr:hypothetical protein B0H16DRAFT_926842 [Mycena metata]
MASYNLTIEDGSPLIIYSPSGAWVDATSTDTAGLPYSGNSFHSTTAQGATATLNFNGTGIEWYGGFQPSYGTYTLAVDGQTVASGTATNTGVEIRQLLGSALGLANGPHTAVLTSTGVGIDLDFVNLITQVGGVGSTTTSTVFDDASSSITYAGDWVTATANTDAYANNTLHYSQSVGAAASLSFSGNGVAVYGTVAPDHANVQVSIDGKTTMVKTQLSSIAAQHAQTLLYYANDLDASQHMLIITNPGQQTGTGPFIDLDSITVYSASSQANAAGDAAPVPSAFSNQGSGPGQPNAAAKSGHLSTGAMVGIVLVVLFAILGLLALVVFLFLRRRRRTQRAVMEPKTPLDAELPLQGPNMRYTTPISPLQPMPTFSGLVSRPRMSAHSIAPSYYAGNNPSRTSVDSTTPMVPKVPTLSMPKVPSRAQQGVMRPNRPPSLDLGRAGG